MEIVRASTIVPTVHGSKIIIGPAATFEAPIGNYDLANKVYVDSHSGGGSAITGNFMVASSQFMDQLPGEGITPAPVMCTFLYSVQDTVVTIRMESTAGYTADVQGAPAAIFFDIMVPPDDVIPDNEEPIMQVVPVAYDGALVPAFFSMTKVTGNWRLAIRPITGTFVSGKEFEISSRFSVTYIKEASIPLPS